MPTSSKKLVDKGKDQSKSKATASQSTHNTRSSSQTINIDAEEDSDSSNASIPAEPIRVLVDSSSKPPRSLRTPVVPRAPSSAKTSINHRRSNTTMDSVNSANSPAYVEGGPVRPQVSSQRAADNIADAEDEAPPPNLSYEERLVAAGNPADSEKRMSILADKTKADLGDVDGEIAKLEKTITSSTSAADPKHNKQKVYDVHLKKGALGHKAITGSYRKDAEFFSGLHDVVKSQVELDEVPDRLRYMPASALEVDEDRYTPAAAFGEEGVPGASVFKPREMTENDGASMDLDGEMHAAFKENNTAGLGGVYVNYKTKRDHVVPDERLEKLPSGGKPSTPYGNDYYTGIANDPSSSLLSLMNTDHTTGKPILKPAEPVESVKPKKWLGDFDPMDFSSHFPICECPECFIKQKTGIRPRLPHIDYGDDKVSAAPATKEVKVKAIMDEELMGMDELDELMG